MKTVTSGEWKGGRMEDGKTGRREKDVDPYRLGITIALLIQSLDLSTQLLVCTSG